MESDFLYANPSILSGFARTLDLAAQFDSYNESMTAEQADTIALLLDWHITGEDFWEAFRQLESEINASVLQQVEEEFSCAV